MAKERGGKKERRKEGKKEGKKEINKERSAGDPPRGRGGARRVDRGRGKEGWGEEGERARRERGAQARRNEIVKREENGCREVFL